MNSSAIRSSSAAFTRTRSNFFPQFAVNPQRLFDTYPEWVLPDAQKRAFISTQDGAIAGKVLADKYGWKVGDIIPLNSFIWTQNDGSAGLGVAPGRHLRRPRPGMDQTAPT